MKKFNTVLLAGVLSGVSAIAMAEDTGIFFGGSVGYSALDQDSSFIDTQLTALGFTGTVDVDDEDLGWKVFFGYNFSRYFGLEVGYVDLGEANTDINITAPVAADVEFETDITGYTVTAIARYPLTDRFEFQGKFGGLFSDSDTTSKFTGLPASLIAGDDDGDTNMTAGLGMKFRISEHADIRADWDRYIQITEADNDVDMFSLGLEFSY